MNSSTMSSYPDISGIYTVYGGRYLLENETLTLNVYDSGSHNVYIDIGCFNGETIEHFIHFTRNSILYDIVTFEPDPINYRLCKEKLSQKKYRDYNIFIIPKVAWIYNGKVPYRVGQGQKSGIFEKKSKKKSNVNNIMELDAIDFSAWLSKFIQYKDTKVHIKLSMPGYESRILQKLVVDETLAIAHQWDVEWAYRSDPHLFVPRIYLQLMFDSFGFTCTSFTLLDDVRHAFNAKLPYENVTKYFNLKVLPDSDTYTHYVQRPSVTESPRLWTTRVNSKKH
ncbi:unnamed protein product [Adineta ricciae]|uniref:Methyltransferase FkbM domain-containing protein n=1 Tax=Adineta ricciae TaxID=249248 RepID=A0A813MU71_ADIRI|nr:unnamed protein product [Adineta ricciae]CAF1360228.1 unnamed protein product [Adineta ricciae]